jgi:hypothetical protein
MVFSSTANWADTNSLVPPEIQKKMPIRTRAAVTGIHSSAWSIVNAVWIMCVMFRASNRWRPLRPVLSPLGRRCVSFQKLLFV